MTRDEALEKVKSISSLNLHYVTVVNALEALGLLKFEEEKKIDYVKMAKDYMDIAQTPYPGAKASVIIKGLLEIIEAAPKPGDIVKVYHVNTGEINAAYKGVVINQK